MDKTLKIMFWNANGVRQKSGELTHFLQQRNIDVALINETHLKPNIDIHVPNYRLYKTDRLTTIGGGTAVLVHKRIKHTQTHTHTDLTHAESTGVNVYTAQGTLKLCAVYNPPQKKLLETDLDLIFAGRNPCIAAGDFNAKNEEWLARCTNRNGQILSMYCDNRQLAITAPTEPTHHHAPTGTSDILDVAVLKNIAHNTNIYAVDELSSDHLPVILEVGNKVHTHKGHSAHVDYALFRASLRTTHTDINDTRELDEAVERFRSEIQHALETATVTHRSCKPDEQFLPDHIVQLIKQKNRARKTYHRTLDPRDKTELNRLNTEVKQKIQEFRNEEWETKLRNLNSAEEHHNVWKLTRSLTGKRRKRRAPAVLTNGGFTQSPEEAAEAFAANLETQFTPNADETPVHTALVETNEHIITNALADTYTFAPITTDEITKIIESLPLNKAPGYDKIDNKTIKNLHDAAIEQLTTIANASLKLRHFPQPWKHSIVVMIHKSGKPQHLTSSYRPISLLPCLSKVLERCIHQRLNTMIADKRLLPDEQHGFRKEHSTTHQLYRLVEKAIDGANRKKDTGAVFLDVTQAFDKVWHAGLLYKLYAQEVPIGFIKLIASYLRGRSYQVRVDDELSHAYEILAGVPQGSVLGPTLYSLYTADIPKHEHTLTLTYADDVGIAAQSGSLDIMRRHLQNHLDTLYAWCNTWRIKINPSKTQAIVFTKGTHVRRPAGTLVLGGTAIAWSDKVRYLGMTLDRKLSFRNHIEETRKKANAVCASLYPLLNRNSPLSLQNKLTIYKQIVRPVLSYGCEVYHIAHSHTKKILERRQNITLRQITNSPWFVTNRQITNDLNTETFAEHIDKRTTVFYEKTSQHSNASIRDANKHVLLVGKRKRPSQK